MAAVGGFVGAYAILMLGHMGNAQTFNLIEMTMNLVGRNIPGFLLRLVGLLIYMLGCITFVVSKHNHLPVEWISLGLNCILFVLMAFWDYASGKVIALYPFFFAMAFQYNSFPGIEKYNSATVFSTNNTRQLSLALGEFFYSKDREELNRASFYLGSLVFLNSGAALCAVLFRYYDQKTILFGYLLQAFAVPFLYKKSRTEKGEKK